MKIHIKPLSILVILSLTLFSCDKKQSQVTQLRNVETREKPDPKNFDTHEAYVSALVSWSIEEKTMPTQNSTGRFQMVQLGTFRRDQFMIDTATGRIWSKTCLVSEKSNTDCSYLGWIQDDVENLSKSRTEIFEKIERIEKRK